GSGAGARSVAGMFKGMLALEDEEVETVRPEPDTTGDAARPTPNSTAAGLETGAGSVRLQPDRDRNLPDGAARAHAVDPARNVLLEASAGTGQKRGPGERDVHPPPAGVRPRPYPPPHITPQAAAGDP